MHNMHSLLKLKLKMFPYTKKKKKRKLKLFPYFLQPRSKIIMLCSPMDFLLWILIFFFMKFKFIMFYLEYNDLYVKSLSDTRVSS